MNIRFPFIATIALLAANTVMADFTPTAYYTADGENLETTDAISDAQAPLLVTFRANPSAIDDGVIPSYEWRFVKDGATTAYLTRYEENTQYEFTESGSTAVSLYVTYSGTGYEEGSESELVSTISVSIRSSILEMRNAFSPNGDGINDIYKAKANHKSIISFKAYIFNRWGQKLYEWSDIDGGWDGTFHGSPVKAGVYYVLVKAKGADGIDYNIKRDINLLRDYMEEAEY
ncbi:MAG: gliding motility-associated C-terminal domain-containing protein [Prevotella sp.]